MRMTAGNVLASSCSKFPVKLTGMRGMCRGQDKYEDFKGDAYAQVAISTNVKSPSSGLTYSSFLSHIVSTRMFRHLTNAW